MKKRLKGCFIVLALFAVLGLAGCAGTNKESYLAEESPLPSSDSAGEEGFFSMDIVPDEMKAQLPEGIWQLSGLAPNDLTGLLTCSRYIEVVGNEYGGVSAVEKTKEDYLDWCDSKGVMADASEMETGNYRPGWLVMSTSTWDAGGWNINVAHVCRWLVEPELDDFDESLYFSWLSGKLVDGSFSAAYGYSDRDGYHIEPLDWEDVPRESDSPWNYKGSLGRLLESPSEGKTLYVGQNHGKSSGRIGETIIVVAQIRKKLAADRWIKKIWGVDYENSTFLSYGMKYVMSPHKNMGNYFFTIAKSRRKNATILGYWKDLIENDANFTYMGNSVPYLRSDDDVEDQYHEEFVFHVIGESLGREPTVAEADLWMARLHGRDDGEAAGGDELLLECFGSDEFESRKLRPIQVINAIRSAAGLEGLGSYTQQQWIRWLEEGLTAREAAEELAHTEEFEQFCERCHVRLSWQGSE